MRGRRLAAFAAAVLAACSSYASVASAPDAGGDASTDPTVAPEGGDDGAGDVAAAVVDGAPLLSNPSFEDDGAVGCGPAWSGIFASLTRIPGAGHSGAYACLVCQNAATASTFGIIQAVSLEGGTYDLQAWARARNDGGQPDGGVALSLVYQLPDGGRKMSTTAAALTTIYTVVQVVATAVPPDAAPYDVKMTSRFPANVGDCFVVDDFVFAPE